jgi:hypothetical protein
MNSGNYVQLMGGSGDRLLSPSDDIFDISKNRIRINGNRFEKNLISMIK